MEILPTINIVAPVTPENPHGYVVINESDHKGEPIWTEPHAEPTKKPDPDPGIDPHDDKKAGPRKPIVKP